MVAGESEDAIQRIRKEYQWAALDESSVAKDPLAQFEHWFLEAVNAALIEPNAMALATVGANQCPAARMVLLKSFNQAGFVFYTNYRSRKGQELKSNQAAALLFYWPELERQVRIEGKAVRASDAQSDNYFASRPAGSQLGALVSAQSEPIENRKVLEDRFATLEDEYRNKVIPRPLHWGGYVVQPHSFEFWQGRENKLHDRILYTRSSSGQWNIERLSP